MKTLMTELYWALVCYESVVRWQSKNQQQCAQFYIFAQTCVSTQRTERISSRNFIFVVFAVVAKTRSFQRRNISILFLRYIKLYFIICWKYEATKEFIHFSPKMKYIYTLYFKAAFHFLSKKTQSYVIILIILPFQLLV